MDENDLGRVFRYATLTRALSDLSPDLHFDMGGKLGIWHPRQDEFAGVFYAGRHIATIDRDWIPEFDTWTMKEGLLEIDPTLAGAIEGASVQFRTIDPSDPDYQVGCELAKTYSQGYAMEDGKLRHYRGYRHGEVRDRCIKVGWRYTLWKIVLADLPGLSQRAIERKLGIDLMKKDGHTAVAMPMSYQEHINGR